ncbi:hypothetical protein ACH4XT_29010 [Streptomyces avidinii]|uniref:hypothetical protein n=1 Tax=Streptomyces avidinii TaxID=1895 RepID=UPI0037872CBF
MPSGPGRFLLTGAGGVGKTQTAAQRVRERLTAGTLELWPPLTELLTDEEELLGPNHPALPATRAALADALEAARRNTT